MKGLGDRRRVGAGLLLAVACAAAGPAAADAARPRPYEGLWADKLATCRDPDGVDRLDIEPTGLFWYETRCRIGSVSPAGPRAWRMRLACQGEGQRFASHPRLTLTGADRLTIAHGPVGPPSGQPVRYVRCPLPGQNMK